MICIRLNGGLGNQMFQYAFGRALSERIDRPLIIDSSYLDNPNPKDQITKRNYELAIFNITSELATTKQLKRFKRSWISKINYKLNSLINFPLLVSNNQLNENNYDLLNSDQLPDDKPYRINGYWQSEDYFRQYENIIREEFTFLPELNEENAKIKTKIEHVNSVSIHIRRGDYVSNPSTNKTHGVCSLDYYKRAIDIIRREVPNPHFFIFSDDFDWVKKNNLVPDSYTLIDWNQGEFSYVDMQLMSCCKHNIIANSSFSWWGAWLNTNKNKLVIAPKQWFADEVKNSKTSNLIPEKWIRI